MIARAHVVARGRQITRMRSQPPIALRDTPDGVYIVGAAAGPLGGDDLTIEVEVADGASLTLRSSAASVVLPGPKPSRVTIHASVGPGACLRFAPEATVLAQGCLHRVESVVSLYADARLEWWEELVLGRYGESPGSATTMLRVDLDGEPLLRHELALGPDHPSSASAAVLPKNARAVGSVVLVGPGLVRRSLLVSDSAAVLPLDGPAVLVTALESDALTARRSLRCGVAQAHALMFTHGDDRSPEAWV